LPTMYEKTAIRYAEQVVAGEILACRWVQQAQLKPTPKPFTNLSAWFALKRANVCFRRYIDHFELESVVRATKLTVCNQPFSVVSLSVGSAAIAVPPRRQLTVTSTQQSFRCARPR